MTRAATRMTWARATFHRVFWWSFDRLIESREIGGLRFYDLRRGGDDRPAAVVEGAWECLSHGAPEFRDAVLEHVPYVIASSFWDVSYYERGAYASRFRELERTSPLFFASQLVWTAEWIRIYKETGEKGGGYVKRRCAGRRFAFIDSVGRPEEWVEPMRARVLG